MCNSDTAAVASELTAQYGELLLRLLAKAYPVHNIDSNIRVLSDLYERAQAEVERTLEEMKHINESGKPDNLRFSALLESCKSSQQEAGRFAEERSGLYKQHKTALHAYTVSMLEELRSIGELQLQFTVAVRSELNLTTNHAEFESRLKTNLARMDKAVQNLLASLDDG